MAAPGGYSQSTLLQIFKGDPLDYQIDGYLARVSASTNQRTLVANKSHKHQACINVDELNTILDNNS